MVSTMSPPPSPQVSGLLNQLSELSKGLENSQPVARKGACKHVVHWCQSLRTLGVSLDVALGAGGFQVLIDHGKYACLIGLYRPTHHTVLCLSLDLPPHETLAKDNGTSRSVEQSAAPRNAEPRLVCKISCQCYFLEISLIATTSRMHDEASGCNGHGQRSRRGYLQAHPLSATDPYIPYHPILKSLELPARMTFSPSTPKHQSTLNYMAMRA